MTQKVLVIGAASAYYLRKKGWQVSMVDQGHFGHGSSHGNCGYVCPSHVLPFLMPEMIRKTLPMVLRRDALLCVKLRPDPAIWSWLFRFARQCRHKPMMIAAHARHALRQSSRQLCEELIEQERMDCEWERRGCLFVFRHVRPMSDCESGNRIMEQLV